MPLYDAFICSSHAKDKPIAGALQSVVQKLGKPWYKRRALRVFRDDTSLSAMPELWPSIETALSKSRFLILFASPEAAASPWVTKEVEYWLENRDPSTLLIGLTAGDLSWNSKTGDFKWSPRTPLPKALKGRFASEPKWVDLRPYRDGADPRDTHFVELGADFAAAIHGMPKEDLLSQEVKQQRRALTLAMGAAASLLVLLGAAVLLYLTADYSDNCRWKGCVAALEANEAALTPSAVLAGPDKPGERLVLTGVVYASDGVTPASDVIVYAYHTNTEGRYADGAPDTVWSRRHGALRGWIRTGPDGVYRFDTIKPGVYPNPSSPAHIHINLVEPGHAPVYIDSVVFDGEFGVDNAFRERAENRGGSGIVRLKREDGVWIARRDIYLGLNMDG